MQEEMKKKILKLLVILIAAHSLIVGLMLMIIPRQLLITFGIYCPDVLFFPNQSGIFHVVLAMGYLLALTGEDINMRCLAFLILAKTIALVFLLVNGIFLVPSLSIILIGLADGLMGLAVYMMMRLTYHKSLTEVIFN